ncbi:NRDE family protein, partial [Pseudomonas viridiflava]|uniref:NRDE family protein n=1 Tax=Pseudomonas viridiflava TaxID=33069 RepID=UPI001981EEC3
GFNLLLGTADQLWHLNSRDVTAQPVEPGLHGISNAGLDTPWPKLLKARAALNEVLVDPQPQALLVLLKDSQTAPFSELPDTGVGLATESLLS